MQLRPHLARLPTELADVLEAQYRNTMEHFLLGEWDDAQVDAGRFCEAVLRLLQWHMKGKYTPIDGKSKPNRSQVVGQARQDTNLPASLRQQVPAAVELIMDFRNNRNVAHLGNIDANKLDATCVVQLASWTMAEVVRLETQKSPREVQAIMDRLAERHVPIIEMVGERPVITRKGMSAGDRVLVLLYNHAAGIDIQSLRKWAEYSNSTRFRKSVIPDLVRERLVAVDDAEVVHLLGPGTVAAEKIMALEVDSNVSP